MASLNRVTLLGNLGKDPEMRYTADGAAVCNVSIATTSQWKDKAIRSSLRMITGD